MHRRRCRPAVVAVIALLSGGAMACGSAESSDGPRPIGSEAVAGPGVASASAPTSSTSPPTSQVDPTTTSPAASSSVPEIDDTLDAVDRVLGRYDAALSAIAADPVAATTPGDPRLGAWFAVVTAESALTEDVLGLLRSEALSDRIVVEPGPDGLSWAHTALAATSLQDRITFSWCGWSPGVARRAGEAPPLDDPALDDPVLDDTVLDDAVAITEGVGEIVQRDGTWLLDELIELDAEIHPHGTPNPCPDRVGRS